MTNQFAEANHLIAENKKKIEWFENIIQSMKKRISEIQKMAKDNAAKIGTGTSGQAVVDPEADAVAKEQVN